MFFKPTVTVNQFLIVEDQLERLHLDQAEKGFRVIHVCRANIEQKLYWVAAVKVDSVVLEMRRNLEQWKEKM